MPERKQPVRNRPVAKLEEEILRLKDEDLTRVLLTLQQAEQVKRLGFVIVAPERKSIIAADLIRLNELVLPLAQAAAKQNKGRPADPDSYKFYATAAVLRLMKYGTWKQIATALVKNGGFNRRVSPNHYEGKYIEI